jgi:hypothetical protein
MCFVAPIQKHWSRLHAHTMRPERRGGRKRPAYSRISGGSRGVPLCFGVESRKTTACATLFLCNKGKQNAEINLHSCNVHIIKQKGEEIMIRGRAMSKYLTCLTRNWDFSTSTCMHYTGSEIVRCCLYEDDHLSGRNGRIKENPTYATLCHKGKQNARNES